jgi:hypothetical protein
VQRLAELVKRKHSIERSIMDIANGMESAFETAAEHMSAGVRGRVEGLQ